MQVKKFPFQHICTWTIALLCFTLPLVTPSPSEAQDPSAKVSVVGLSLTLKDDDNIYSGPSGVEVKLKIAGVTQRILKVAQEEDEASSISITTNDGKVLKNENAFSNSGFMANIAENGLSVTYPVSVSELPPSGTTSLKVKGNVKLIIGDDIQTMEAKFEPKVDTKVTLGAVETVIGSVEKSFDEQGIVVEFKSKKSMESIAEIEFLDENGKQLESSSAGTSSFSFGGGSETSSYYQLNAIPKSLTAKVKYYRSTRELSVPVNVELDLGLEKK